MWFERKQQQQEIMNQMLLASTKCDENFGITFSQCEDSLTQHCTNEEQNKKIALDVIPTRLYECERVSECECMQRCGLNIFTIH